MASKRFKFLTIAGLSTALLAAIPAVSSAGSHYTGKLPPAAIDMTPQQVVDVPVTTAVARTVKHSKVKSKKTKKLSTASTKHKKAKKHGKKKVKKQKA